MTDKEINIAIAEACGWILTAMNWWFKDGEYFALPPDYCNNLNAMHEAEKTTLKNDALLWHKYASLLDRDYCNQPYTIGSTARQRAEAFLKTLNLWKP